MNRRTAVYQFPASTGDGERPRFADKDLLRECATRAESLSVTIRHYADDPRPLDLEVRSELIRASRELAEKVRQVIA